MVPVLGLPCRYMGEKAFCLLGFGVGPARFTISLESNSMDCVQAGMVTLSQSGS